MTSIETERKHETKYQDNIVISNLARNLEREWELVCKDRLYVDSGVCSSQEGGSPCGASKCY
jgi:hypothetical protein